MITSVELEDKLKALFNKEVLVPRTENNVYLKVSYKGSGTVISSKWNVKIYTSGSIVCNDEKVLLDILGDKIKPPDIHLTLLQIDDAGVGFVLGGVMVGVTDGSRVVTDVVDVSFFKPGPFEKKLYLKEYAKKGLKIVQDDFKAIPKTHRIEICTGFINQYLRDTLRDQGFDVRVVEIKGMLQDNLENLFREYIKKETGADLAYDPKEISKSELGKNYYKVLEWGRKHTPHLLKSGWGALR